MKTSMRVVCAAVSFLLCIGGVYQASGGDGQRVTLEEAVRLSLKHNHDLASSRLEVQRADARVKEARGYALPRVDFAGRYTNAILKPVFFLPGSFFDATRTDVVPVEIGSTHSFDLNFTASQVLFNSAIFTGIGTAKIYSDAARDLYRSKELETVTAVRKAFYGVLVAGELVTLMRVNLKNAEDNLQNVRLLTAHGLVAEYDQLRAQVGVDNIRPEVIRTENAYVLALDNLKIAIGIPFERDLDVQGALEFTPVDSAFLEQVSVTVLSVNPQLSALRRQAQVNDAMISIEWSNHLPSLAAFGNYEFQAQKNQFRFATDDFVRSSLVGLSLSLNIFSGMQIDARIEQARLELRKTQEQVTGLETTLRTAVQSVISQLQQARQRIEAQQHTVQQAERGYKIASTRFASGSGTQLEVNDAERALTQSKVNKIQAVYDYLVASADLDQLLGRLPPYAVAAGE